MHKFSAAQISIALHVAFLLAIAAFYYKPNRKFENVVIEVYENPVASSQAQLQPQPVKPPEEQQKPPPRKAVFGVTRKSLTDSSNEAGAETKAGNTIAKEMDQLQLDPNDDSSLPIPVDDYLVTQMPKIKKEVRAPYPEEAKKNGVEGPVIMDVLIDPTGRVREVIVLSGPGFGLNEAAVQALKQFEFAPARVQEQFVAVKIKYKYTFKLSGI